MLCCLLMAYASRVSAQIYISITVDEAVELALEQDPSMLLADLKVIHKEKLSQTGVANQPTQISFSGEEFNFEGSYGVQSLNVQQTFNLPQVAKASKAYFRAQMESAMHLKTLTRKELIRNVEVSYYRLEVAKREEIISRDTENLYRELYNRSKIAFESGEENKAPMLSTQLHLKKASLEINHALHEIEVARELLNLWLGAKDKYDIVSVTYPETLNELASITDENPYLSIYEYEKDVINKKIEMQKSLLLPQLNSGLRLQSVNGDLLFFGYQVGINIPLFRGAANRRIEATKVELDIVDASRNIKQRELERTTLRLKNHIRHLLEKIEYYDIELLPSVNEQVNQMKESYQQGEGTYLEYMISLKSYNELRSEKLKLIQDFYLSSTELKYWTANY